MTRRLFALIGMLAAMAWPIAAHGDITTYTQDFEGLELAGSSTSAPNSLSNDGWKVYGNVFLANGSYQYGYGPFAAPNGGPCFSAVATDPIGPRPNTKYLNVYSDYNSEAHANGKYNEALVFQERTIGASNVGAGKAFSFSFDHLKNGPINGDGDSRTFAFVKVLKSSDFSYALLGQIEFETTNASTSTWANHAMQLAATDLSWAGELVQFGFRSYATNYKDTGRFYDNLNFSAVPEPSSVGLLSASMLGFLFRRRRAA
ncbi:MAG: PEP-CTERM sorting domain-containing protein [Planctomycetota bacterium]